VYKRKGIWENKGLRLRLRLAWLGALAFEPVVAMITIPCYFMGDSFFQIGTIKLVTPTIMASGIVCFRYRAERIITVVKCNFLGHFVVATAMFRPFSFQITHEIGFG